MPAQLANESFRADHVRFGNSVGAVVQVPMRSDVPAAEAFFVTIFLLITPQSRTQRNGPLRTRRHRWESNSDVVLVQSFTIGRVLCTQYCELTLRQMAAHKMKCSKQEVNCETQYEERSTDRSVASA